MEGKGPAHLSQQMSLAAQVPTVWRRLIEPPEKDKFAWGRREMASGRSIHSRGKRGHRLSSLSLVDRNEHLSPPLSLSLPSHLLTIFPKRGLTCVAWQF